MIPLVAYSDRLPQRFLFLAELSITTSAYYIEIDESRIMSSSKRERETPEYMPSEEEYKSEASEPTTPKKKSKTTPHSSPTKCKTEGGEKPRSWTAEENAIITRGVQALITWVSYAA